MEVHGSETMKQRGPQNSWDGTTALQQMSSSTAGATGVVGQASILQQRTNVRCCDIVQSTRATGKAAQEAQVAGRGIGYRAHSCQHITGLGIGQGKHHPLLAIVIQETIRCDLNGGLVGTALSTAHSVDVLHIAALAQPGAWIEGATLRTGGRTGRFLDTITVDISSLADGAVRVGDGHTRNRGIAIVGLLVLIVENVARSAKAGSIKGLEDTIRTQTGTQGRIPDTGC